MHTPPWTRPTTAIAVFIIGSAACAIGTADPLPDDAAAPPPTDGSVGHDSGAHDSGARDTSVADTGTAPDAGDPDTFVPDDTSTPDTSTPDTSTPDTGTDTGTLCAHAFSGALATFDFTGQTGSEASVAATSTATAVTAGPMTRSAALTAASGAGSINSSGWATGASADPTRYYTFTITPPAGCSATLASLALDVRASATGPASGDVATSVGAFGTHSTPFAGSSTSTATLSATSTGAIEVRIYGYGASGSGGTFRVQTTMTLSGSIN